jgi:hypothetical protein
MKKTSHTGQGTLGVAGVDTNLESIANDAAQVGMGVLIALAALIGIWGIACLVGGIVNSGSILDMATGFVAAVTGH